LHQFVMLQGPWCKNASLFIKAHGNNRKEEETMLTGGCLCGGVRYEYDGDITEISMCHCAQCRKAQGCAYVAVSPVDASKLRLVEGVELLKEYRATPGRVRVFSSCCGSPLYSARDDLPAIKRLRLGTVETPFQCSNAYHIHTASKADWAVIADGFPQHAQWK